MSYRLCTGHPYTPVVRLPNAPSSWHYLQCAKDAREGRWNGLSTRAGVSGLAHRQRQHIEQLAGPLGIRRSRHMEDGLLLESEHLRRVANPAYSTYICTYVPTYLALCTLLSDRGGCFYGDSSNPLTYQRKKKEP